MIFQNDPFGENVEGFSYCGNKSCVIEMAVQKDDFQYSTLISEQMKDSPYCRCRDRINFNKAPTVLTDV
jgi:hypothetical protein